MKYSTPKWMSHYVGGPEIPEEVQCPKCWTTFVELGICQVCQDTEIMPVPFSEVWGL